MLRIIPRCVPVSGSMMRPCTGTRAATSGWLRMTLTLFLTLSDTLSKPCSQRPRLIPAYSRVLMAASARTSECTIRMHTAERRQKWGNRVDQRNPFNCYWRIQHPEACQNILSTRLDFSHTHTHTHNSALLQSAHSSNSTDVQQYLLLSEMPTSTIFLRVWAGLILLMPQSWCPITKISSQFSSYSATITLRMIPARNDQRRWCVHADSLQLCSQDASIDRHHRGAMEVRGLSSHRSNQQSGAVSISRRAACSHRLEGSCIR